jgi:hypothetical protein
MIFARLLIMTRYIELTAQEASLPRRTVVRLTAEEWAELCADPQFAKIHDGKDYTIMNDVLLRKETPKVERAQPATVPQATVPWGDPIINEDDLEAALSAISGTSGRQGTQPD